jgi:hypothetical protein
MGKKDDRTGTEKGWERNTEEGREEHIFKKV